MAVGRCYGYHPTTLAKKARTPTPPRPIQAPKRRDTKQRQPISASDRRTRFILYGFAALGPLALVIVLAVVLLGGNSNSGKATGKAPNIDYAALPGIQKGSAPWPPEYAALPDRRAAPDDLVTHAVDQVDDQRAFRDRLDVVVVVEPEAVTVAPMATVADTPAVADPHAHADGRRRRVAPAQASRCAPTSTGSSIPGIPTT